MATATPATPPAHASSSRAPAHGDGPPHHVPVTPSSDRSVGELLRDLSEGTVQLVRDEIRLARTELAESLHEARGGIAQLGVAIVLATCAAGVLVAGITLLLSAYVFGGRTWLAALVVGLVLGVVALVYAKRGSRALSPSRLVPDDTLTSLSETKAWLKHPTQHPRHHPPPPTRHPTKSAANSH